MSIRCYKLSVALGTLLVGVGTFLLGLSSCRVVDRYTINIDCKKFSTAAKKTIVDSSEKRVQDDIAATGGNIQLLEQILDEIPTSPTNRSAGIVPTGVYMDPKLKAQLKAELRKPVVTGQLQSEVHLMSEMTEKIKLDYAPPQD